MIALEIFDSFVALLGLVCLEYYSCLPKLEVCAIIIVIISLEMKLASGCRALLLTAVVLVTFAENARAEDFYRHQPAGCTYVTKQRDGGYSLVECSRSGETRTAAIRATEAAAGVVKLNFPIGAKNYSGYWCSRKARKFNTEASFSRECTSKGWIPGKNYAK